MTNQELAEHVQDALLEFSPAINVYPGRDADQVVLEIVMSRTRNADLRQRSRSAEPAG